MFADGVENQVQRDLLHKHGVHYAQGWLFGQPMNIQQLQAFIEQRSGHTSVGSLDYQAVGGFNAGSLTSRSTPP